MLAIAAVTLLYALLLAARKRWVLWSSVALAAVTCASVIYLQVAGRFLNVFLAAVALIALVYAFGLGWALKRLSDTGSQSSAAT